MSCSILLTRAMKLSNHASTSLHPYIPSSQLEFEGPNDHRGYFVWGIAPLVGLIGRFKLNQGWAEPSLVALSLC